jgi:hypothetical protein
MAIMIAAILNGGLTERPEGLHWALQAVDSLFQL